MIVQLVCHQCSPHHHELVDWSLPMFATLSTSGVLCSEIQPKVRSLSVPAQCLNKAVQPSMYAWYSGEGLSYSMSEYRSSTSRLFRKCPSWIYHLINSPTPGTTQSSRHLKRDADAECSGDRTPPLCLKGSSSEQNKSSLVREWKELINLRIFETVQEWIAASNKCVTVQKMGPFVTGRCSLVRSNSSIRKYLRFLNLYIVKKPDIGRVSQLTNIFFVEANGRLGCFLTTVWSLDTRCLYSLTSS